MTHRISTVRTDSGAATQRDDNPFMNTSVVDTDIRADALAALLQPSISDGDIARIAEAVATLVADRVSLADVPEMMRPMDQGEAAAWLGVNRSTLSQWTNQDDDPVPAFRIGGKVLYTKADLISYVRRHPVASRDEAA